jgi:hypothetical protein
MITLTIKKSDGAVYWTEYFKSQAECDKWLSEEKTRHYWEHDLAPWTSVADPVPVIDPVAEAAKQAKDDAKKSRQVIAQSLKGKSLQPAEIKAAVELLLAEFFG